MGRIKLSKTQEEFEKLFSCKSSCATKVSDDTIMDVYGRNGYGLGGSIVSSRLAERRVISYIG